MRKTFYMLIKFMRLFSSATNLRRALVVVLFLFLTSPSVGESMSSYSFGEWREIPHGKARIFRVFDSGGASPSGPRMGAHVLLDKHWHTYWRNPGDSGSPPEVYAFRGEAAHKLEISYPFPQRFEVGPISTYGYADQNIYFFDTPAFDYDKVVLDLLVCEIECIPGSIEEDAANLKMERSKADPSFNTLYHKMLSRTPESSKLRGEVSYSSRSSQWRLEVPTSVDIVDIFWLPEQVKTLKKPQLIRSGNKDLSFYLDSVRSDVLSPKALIVYREGNVEKSTVVAFEQASPNLPAFLLMAIVGGLILNFMPCVFPIVSLKAFSIASASGKALDTIRRDNLMYSLGVIVCFVALAASIVLVRQSGQYVGWGFQLQNPWFVGFLSLLFFILGLSFFDLWSINRIPNVFLRISNGTGSRGKQSFLTGLLAVIVASPCTAPFMGAAVGFALSQPLHIILFIFLSLGLGMALPFIVFAIFPASSRFLPKPGVWMVHFKRLMGALLILSSVWLAWIGFQIVSDGDQELASEWINLEMQDWSKMHETPGPKFINFTADWCVSCKFNERVVFSNSKVKNYFHENGVTLFKVDWTKKQSAIGEKLAEYGRAGVPLYIYFPEGQSAPRILPELLTPDLLISKLETQK